MTTIPSSEELLEALDDDQRAVAQHLTGPLCVLAGAGCDSDMSPSRTDVGGSWTGTWQFVTGGLTVTDAVTAMLTQNGTNATGNLLRAPYLTDAMDAYINDRPWSEQRVHKDAECAGFTNVEVRGMRHPLFGPNENRSALWHDLWMRLEPKLFRADSMSFLVITATRATG